MFKLAARTATNEATSACKLAGLGGNIKPRFTLRVSVVMPSKTPKQARLMAAAAHTPGGFGGVPQSVGKDFNSADKGKGIIKPAKKNKKK